MSDIEIIVGKSGDGMRLELWLPENVPGLSRNKANEMIRKGLIKVNDENGNKGRKLKAGQKVSITTEKTLTKPKNVGELVVLFENEDVLIVNKPAGMACHPLRLGENDTLLDWVGERYPEIRSSGPIEREGGLLHRLDTDTSGTVAFARSLRAYDKLKPLFQEGGVDKHYLAVVSDDGGKVRLPEVGGKGITINFPLAHHPSKPERMISVINCDEYWRGALMPARTEILTLAKGNGCALVEAKIKKGRMHQIRVHLSAIGHPIIGDTTYGTKDNHISRHTLHAYRLIFNIGKTKIDVTAPLPDDIKKLCEKRQIKSFSDLL